MLERIWVRECRPGDGEIFLISGFGNYNGGVRFYPTFKAHAESGGRILVFFSGSTAQRLTSKQVVEEMLNCNAEVRIINRKRLLHAKCYGTSSQSKGDTLIVTSGNFTGPGMSQNVESSVLLEPEITRRMNFSWRDLCAQIDSQAWEVYRPLLGELEAPVWKLLYDEISGAIALDDSQEVTLLVTLGHNDTARIQAEPGTDASKGSQYFWLSRDCFDFFPPLTIRNVRGSKQTFSTKISLKYVDLDLVDPECRVTFEAENNLDFRLGTGKLRGTRLAKPGDLAAISRLGETDHELRIFKEGTSEFVALAPYVLNFIGNRGKRFGYIANIKFQEVTGIVLPRLRLAEARGPRTRIAVEEP